MQNIPRVIGAIVLSTLLAACIVLVATHNHSAPTSEVSGSGAPTELDEETNKLPAKLPGIEPLRFGYDLFGGALVIGASSGQKAAVFSDFQRDVGRGVDPITGEKTYRTVSIQSDISQSFWIPKGYQAQQSFVCDTNGITGEVTDTDLSGVTSTSLRTQLNGESSVISHNNGVSTVATHPGILSIASSVVSIGTGIAGIAGGERRLLGGDKTTTTSKDVSWTDVAGSAFSTSDLIQRSRIDNDETYSKVTQASATGSMYTIQIQNYDDPSQDHYRLKGSFPQYGFTEDFENDVKRLLAEVKSCDSTDASCFSKASSLLNYYGQAVIARTVMGYRETTTALYHASASESDIAGCNQAVQAVGTQNNDGAGANSNAAATSQYNKCTQGNQGHAATMSVTKDEQFGSINGCNGKSLDAPRPTKSTLMTISALPFSTIDGVEEDDEVILQEVMDAFVGDAFLRIQACTQQTCNGHGSCYGEWSGYGQSLHLATSSKCICSQGYVGDTCLARATPAPPMPTPPPTRRACRTETGAYCGNFLDARTVKASSAVECEDMCLNNVHTVQCYDGFYSLEDGNCNLFDTAFGNGKRCNPNTARQNVAGVTRFVCGTPPAASQICTSKAGRYCCNWRDAVQHKGYNEASCANVGAAGYWDGGENTCYVMPAGKSCKEGCTNKDTTQFTCFNSLT